MGLIDVLMWPFSDWKSAAISTAIALACGALCFGIGYAAGMDRMNRAVDKQLE